MTEQEKCPKCGNAAVIISHATTTGQVDICCDQCGYGQHQGTFYRVPAADGESQRLRDENARLQSQLQQAQAACAAYLSDSRRAREALDAGNTGAARYWLEQETVERPHPGQPILDEMERLRGERDTARDGLRQLVEAGVITQSRAAELLGMTAIEYRQSLAAKEGK